MVSNLDAVQRELDALQQRYGDVPVEREDPPFEAPPDLFRAMVEAASGGTVHSGYVWVRRSSDQFPSPPAAVADAAAATSTRVLFIYNRADDHTWTIPGGGMEPGESFEDAAHRELAEETGIEASITGLRKTQHRVAVPNTNEVGFEMDEVHALYAVFDAEYEGGELDIQTNELFGAAWFDRTPEHVHDLIADQSIANR